MKLSDVTNEYVIFKRSLGLRFVKQASMFSILLRIAGIDADLDALSEFLIAKFLIRESSNTGFNRQRFHALVSFERFVVGRGYAVSLPLPRVPPKPSSSFVPYVLTQEEIRRLLQAVPYHRQGIKLQAETMRAILLVLYGAGLRVSEALSLTVADLDVPEGTLTIRGTKFYKTRLVPLGSCLLRSVVDYLVWRKSEGHSTAKDSQLFVLRSGEVVNYAIVSDSFLVLRKYAQVRTVTGQMPRLHDLRHSFAVHRLLQWYTEGADVQRLLPTLSTYLGHVRLHCTQRYLTMTPELLRQASIRFEAYTGHEVRHV